MGGAKVLRMVCAAKDTGLEQAEHLSGHLLERGALSELLR